LEAPAGGPCVTLGFWLLYCWESLL
jgi:hypothetical protein